MTKPPSSASPSRRALLAAAAGWALARPCLAHAADQVVSIALRPDLSRAGTVFEGWGTALAWFANVTGGWPDADRERLADLLYGPDGLGWTIARYNIGGGDAPQTKPYLRPGAAVPGFWRQPPAATGTDWWRPEDPAMWDWSADASQRWWLDAIKARVRAPIFEAFSNSPPWFMTVSGKVSGAEKEPTTTCALARKPPSPPISPAPSTNCNAGTASPSALCRRSTSPTPTTGSRPTPRRARTGVRSDRAR
jgi:hypothetical protein